MKFLLSIPCQHRPRQQYGEQIKYTLGLWPCLQEGKRMSSREDTDLGLEFVYEVPPSPSIAG
jgi:hypothetical protein